MKTIISALFITVLTALGAPFLHAAERAALVREAVIYLSPDTSSAKLGEAGRGREVAARRLAGVRRARSRWDW